MALDSQAEVKAMIASESPCLKETDRCPSAAALPRLSIAELDPCRRMVAGLLPRPHVRGRRPAASSRFAAAG